MDGIVRVKFYNGSEIVNAVFDFVFKPDSQAEDALFAAARHLKIRPACIPLFGLQIIGKENYYLAPSQNLSKLEAKNRTVKFRLRFFPYSLERLQELDEVSLKYLYWQVREAFIQGEFSFPSEQELGLVVTDILHHTSMTGDSVGDVEFKPFFPKSSYNFAIKYNVKRKVSELLGDPSKCKDAAFLRSVFLKKVEECYEKSCQGDKDETLPLWGSEKATANEGESESQVSARIFIAPYHPNIPGISISKRKKGSWSKLCDIGELVVLSARLTDFTVELARQSGTPFYLQFSCEQSLYSFVSCLSGYYRLLKCWTFDLCMQIPTRSIEFLRKINCHGPIGLKYSCYKLRKKSDKVEQGFGILRLSSLEYDVYKLDVTTGIKNGPLVNTHVIRKNQQEKYSIEGTPLDSSTNYSSVSSVIKAVMDYSREEGNEVILKELLHASVYDKPEQLLLCADFEELYKKVENDSGPKVFSINNFTKVNDTVINGRFYRVAFAKRGRGEETKHFAIKVPSLEAPDDTNTFLSMCNEWLQIRNCESIVLAHGICLSPLALVMDQVPLGRLDRYLSNYKGILHTVDLIEAVTHLAKALWHLSQLNIRHFNIRCSSLLVAEHDKNKFLVKLCEPGNAVFDASSIHWVPVEHHQHLPSSKFDPSTDVWAFATTAWQIFSHGVLPLDGSNLDEVKSHYASGHILTRPAACPLELYEIMRRCWSFEPIKRGEPQTIMRDTFQILYAVFNSRRQPAPYATIADDGIDEDEEAESSQGTSEPKSKTEVNPIYGQSTSSISMNDYNFSASSANTTCTLINEDDNASVATLIDVGDMEDSDKVHRAALAKFPAEINFENLTNSPRAAGSSQTTSIVPGLTRLPILPPIRRSDQQYHEESSNQGPSLHELLVAPTAVEDGRLRKGQVLKMGQSTVCIDTGIGEGNYGWVYRAELRSADGNQDPVVAVKTLKVAAGMSDDMAREIKILKKLNHHSIVRLIGVIKQGGQVDGSIAPIMYMVMEYLPMGSLKTYLKGTPHISDMTLLNFAQDVAEGMDFLQENRIVHRDLAARNLLVASENSVKISDFGLAQQLNTSAYYVYRTSRDLPLPWYAPESIENMRYSHKTDVWSYGVTCWEMFTRGGEPDLPRDPHLLLKALKNDIRLKCTPSIPYTVYAKLIRPCWDADPEARPSFWSVRDIISEVKAEL